MREMTHEAIKSETPQTSLQIKRVQMFVPQWSCTLLLNATFYSLWFFMSLISHPSTLDMGDKLYTVTQCYRHTTICLKRESA